MAHWLAMRQGISQWKARRWIAAGHALEHLTDLARALSSGELGIDKVVELARFATFESEAGLVSWARYVSAAAVRRRADLEVRRTIEDVRDAEHARFLNWWWLDDGNRFGLEAELPTSQGAIVARALQRMSDSIPLMPGEDDLRSPRHAEPTRWLPCVPIGSRSTPTRIVRPSSFTLSSATWSELRRSRGRGRRIGSSRTPHAACSVTRGCRRCWRTETANRFDSDGCRGIRRRP